MDRNDPFDRRYGTETVERLAVSQAAAQAENAQYGLAYWPTSEAQFRRMLGAIDFNPADFVYIDIGCGKGRTLLMAAEYPFRRAIGIEFSDRLCQAARRNIGLASSLPRKCSEVEVLCLDATDFVFPSESMVIYLFNPFVEVIMRKFVKNLATSLERHPRPVFLLYYHPACHTTVLGTGIFELLAREPARGREFGWCLYGCVP